MSFAVLWVGNHPPIFEFSAATCPTLTDTNDKLQAGHYSQYPGIDSLNGPVQRKSLGAARPRSVAASEQVQSAAVFEDKAECQQVKSLRPEIQHCRSLLKAHSLLDQDQPWPVIVTETNKDNWQDVLHFFTLVQVKAPTSVRIPFTADSSDLFSSSLRGSFQTALGRSIIHRILPWLGSEESTLWQLSECYHFHQLLRKKMTYEYNSFHDCLSGLPNRRFFDTTLTREVDCLLKAKKDFSILVIDIDYFKTFNDKHGHLTGDQVLQSVAQLLKKLLTPNGTVCRYGGEEFVALIEMGEEKAYTLAEEVRQAIAHNSNLFSPRRPVTVSIGLSSARQAHPPQPGGLCKLLKLADQALLHAKRNGRNRVCRFEPSPCLSSPWSQKQ